MIVFSFIFILSSPITTFKNLTFLTFHLYFSSVIYKSFSANIFTTFFTTLSYIFSSVPTITSSIKLTTFLILIKFYRILLLLFETLQVSLLNQKQKIWLLVQMTLLGLWMLSFTYLPSLFIYYYIPIVNLI